jgi:Mitochondrial ribosomal subunit protein
MLRLARAVASSTHALAVVERRGLATVPVSELVSGAEKVRRAEQVRQREAEVAKATQAGEALVAPGAPVERVTVTVPLEDVADLEAAFVFDDVKDLRTPRWAPGDDPLVKLGLPWHALKFSMKRTLVQGYEGAPPRDSKASLRANLSDLGFESRAEMKWAREVLGPRFDWVKNEAVIVARRYPHSADNMRLCAEQLAGVITTARELAAKHGDFDQRAPRTHLQHLRQRRRRKHNPKPVHKRHLPL